MRNQSVLISGVGIAGPTLAYWLMECGFTPTLVERAPQPRTGGYAIDFWGVGYDIAEQMGLLPELAHKDYRVQELRFVGDRGQRVGGFKVDVFRRMTGGRYVTLPRGDLAEILYRSIEDRCEILFGDSIRCVEETGDSVRVLFEHASPRSFDLLVGADGLHSAVRPLVFGNDGSVERYLGHAVAAFAVDGYRPRDEGVYVSYGVPGKQAGRFALRHDRTLFLLVFAAAEPPSVDPHDISGQRVLLRRVYHEAGWECPQILDALDGCEELYFDWVSQIRMDRWSQGRVALVGDAAYCPSLLAGQGSALAMTGSYVLAGELAKSDGQHRPAFEHYESLLRSLIDGKQKAAERFAGSLVPKTRLGLFLRNQISKVIGLPFVADLALGRGLVDRLTCRDTRFVRTKLRTRGPST
jgi:2-polyprenyl-6-methoxyphenol hydroxylase-like FAD-dependent oxidoreductase